jgi:hypothetical protein
MTWAQRLKRVFGIDIETCSVCGGAVRIITCIEDPVVIEKIAVVGCFIVMPTGQQPLPEQVTTLRRSASLVSAEVACRLTGRIRTIRWQSCFGHGFSK